MKYWATLGLDKATLIERYFMSEDPAVKEKAYSEVLEIMGTLEVDPLAFEPGTSWAYGQGTDWAGQLVRSFSFPLPESLRY